MYTFSIIVPTYNRFPKLRLILDSLENQSYDKAQFEVIVVNDGSTDTEYKQYYALPQQYKLNLQLLAQENGGAARARNAGVHAATGKYILFLGDDTYAEPTLLQEHEHTHAEHPGSSVLGFVDWYSKLEMNEIMQFIAPYGPQFDFAIPNPLDCGYRRFYTSNISVERAALSESPFNTDFPGCNWEDVDLGYRLEKQGIKIVYNAKAIVYHDHQYQLDQFLKRQERSGENKKIFLDLHPELRTLWSNHLFLRCMLLKYSLYISLGSLFGKTNMRLQGLCMQSYIHAFLKADRHLTVIP